MKNYSEAAFLLDQPCMAVKASYQPQKSRPEKFPDDVSTFKSFIPDLQEGELVVVTSKARWGFSVCKVTEVGVTPELDTDQEVQWIVARVPMEIHEGIIEQEKMIIAKIKAAELEDQKDELRKKMMGSRSRDIAALPLLPGTTVDSPKS